MSASSGYQPNRQLLHAGLSPFRRAVETMIEYALLFCGSLSILITIAIAVVVLNGTVQFFTHPTERVPVVVSYRHTKQAIYTGHLSPFASIPSAAAAMASAQDVYAEKEATVWEFLTHTQWEAGYRATAEHRLEYGILPLLTGTLMVALIAALVALPMGLITAVFLSEYASPGIRDFVKPILELLAGIPTVVYGFFAITVITPTLLQAGIWAGLPDNWLSYPQNQLAGGIVVGIMILPMVASLSEDALRSVPNPLREASYALGATKFETSWRVVVPAALSGIIASFILAMSRAIGETMAVSLAVGEKPHLSFDPTEGAATMTSFMVKAAQGDVQHGSAYFLSLFAVAGMLFLITLGMNIVSQWILHRFRQVYQ